MNYQTALFLGNIQWKFDGLKQENVSNIGLHACIILIQLVHKAMLFSKVFRAKIHCCYFRIDINSKLDRSILQFCRIN